MLDEADFIVRKDWADDAWSFFRGLKDTDTALSPFFGLILSGYRELKEYRQQVGSPLYNIAASVSWLQTLDDSEAEELSNYRIQQEGVSINRDRVKTLIQWSGCHPFLIQQTLNFLFDNLPMTQSSIWEESFNHLIRNNKHHFEGWWNKDRNTDGFGEAERSVYKTLVENKKESIEKLSNLVNLSQNDVIDALEVLAGTGVIRQLDEQYYIVGAQLFEKWVQN